MANDEKVGSRKVRRPKTVTKSGSADDSGPAVQRNILRSVSPYDGATAARIPTAATAATAATETAKVLVEMSDRGTITLPKRFRSAALFEVRKLEDGSIHLVPQAAIDASQSWFWTERWQRMESEADADVQAGRVRRYASGDDFIAELDKI